MKIKDELLRNTKKVWAVIFLCFNFTRNASIMMKKCGGYSDEGKHKNAMFCIIFLGFVWFVLYTSA